VESEQHEHTRLALILRQLEQLNRKADKLMSVITDWAATEQADLTAIATTLNGVVTGIQALDAQITALQQQLAGGLSADDQAALTAIKTASDALVTQAQSISTAPPAAS
jgi:hypothetical protein